ncbi:MAG TPA: hypothetical protein VLN91_07230 [Nitrospirota bacterium]|nr:hypothetical protein [Nitrospirota bacterium]
MKLIGTGRKSEKALLVKPPETGDIFDPEDVVFPERSSLESILADFSNIARLTMPTASATVIVLL